MTAANLQRVLVTGSTGFIGSRLTQRLVAEGREVAVVVRPDSPLDQLGDVASQVELLRHDGTTSQLSGFVESFSPEIVFHLAENFICVNDSEHVATLVADKDACTAQECQAMFSA
ncbi:MAG: NAD(P)-dependent oxidoreductase, partial [Alphaproteobacteria bacterium]|nr:NAD(P)-dependent oxidoreductase [Alphaproteobacteria bacterium]